MKDTMANRYYIIAMILTFLWIIGFLFYDFGPGINIFLVIAFIMILSRIIRDE